MVLMIRKATEEGRTVLRLAGRLSSAGAAQLQKVCEASGLPRILDLTDLQWADPDGVREIRRLVARGTSPRGATPFIELLLRGGLSA